ncbi:hypothetical protein TRFO_04479 [Tritrichomonas foetus]|uniref:Uncharacterized protein n=1 Tax=Tritrichomonas foetus TaxID=1144522 RepID=A0A1J4KG54_9EUKA|nr:hypothetical protein TRFO_04479 [Tritrichomonas foetus]|eukprot:OHT09920.1 hypothetical protein TRFO_04479 [Tritrichomonas foetus]
MDSDPHQEIEKLKVQIEHIRTQFHFLLSQEDPASLKYVKEIETATEERAADVEKYRVNEEKASNMLCDGMLFQLDDEFEQAKNNISERLIDFLRFKCSVISENFPRAHDYFHDKNCEFLDTIYREKGHDPKTCDGYNVELSNQPIVPEDDLNKKIHEYNEGKNYFVKDSTLHYGNKQFGIGTSVVLSYYNNQKMPITIPCTISDINQRYIEFLVSEGKSRRVRLEALRYKICSLKRV